MRKSAFSILLLPLLTQCRLLHTEANVAQTTGAFPAFDENRLPAVSQLGKSFFRKFTQGADDSAFEERWHGAKASPLLFFRSFVRPYYVITKDLVNSGFPIGRCVGDAHPDNFGFVEFFKSEPRYVYNDLDDSGICPLPLDALRYFTALRLIDHGDFVKSMIDRYVDTLTGDRDPVELRASLVPDFEKVRKKLVDHLVKKDHFDKKEDTLLPVPAPVAASIAQAISAVTNSLPIGEQKVLDIREAVEHGGGSRGLTRFWALVVPKGEDHDSRWIDILELKKVVEPAVDGGNWGRVNGDRLKVLQGYFWPVNMKPRIYESLVLNGEPFIIRSRVKTAFTLDDLDKDDRTRVIKTQASILAQIHRTSLPKLPPSFYESYAEWLKDGSKALAHKYEEMFKAYF